MGLRKILTYKDPALHKVCRPVEKFDWRLHKLLNDMTDTLAEANGVGLAAPQVGILRRVVIVDTGEEILELVNPELLETALTHTSYANESRVPVKHNERLEFLGDSVLQIVSADYLFHAYADRPEGDLTRIRASLVSEGALFQFAQEIDLGEYLRLGRGEERCGGRTRPSVVSDAFEAVIAALYLDGGMEVARKFILPFITEGKHAEADYKTRLQEIVQQNPEERLSYVVESESGPDHDKHFVVAVRFNSDRVARGEGRSKKAAEQCAAKEALKLLGVIKEK